MSRRRSRLNGAAYYKKAEENRQRESKILQENNRSKFDCSSAGKYEDCSCDGGECSKDRRLHSPDKSVDFLCECEYRICARNMII